VRKRLESSLREVETSFEQYSQRQRMAKIKIGTGALVLGIAGGLVLGLALD
jgi:hypothetical protein